MIRPKHRTLVLAAALAALAGTAAVPVLVRPAAEARADAVDDDIAALKALVKAKDMKGLVKKLTELEGKNDARYVEEFADIARNPAVEDQPAKTAMKMAAQRKHAELFKWLKSKLDDKKMIEDKPERYLGVLDSLAFYGDKAAAKDLAEVVKKHLADHPEISKRAIAAFGAIRENATVEQLIEWLEQTEKTGAAGGTGGGSGGGGKGLSTQTKENYGKAKTAVLKALTALTQQDIADAVSWQKWWKENEKGFEFPDPNAPEPDFATLKEFVDKAYGYTMKKPDAQFFVFAKPTREGGRVTLNYRDDAGVLWADGTMVLWKANKEIASLEQFAKWYEKDFQEAEFEKFAKDGEPKIEAKKIGGREFLVVSARGMAKGSIKSWESCERRAYLTMGAPGLFLYADCTIRSGADQPVKDAFWGAFDGIVFKKP